MELIDFKRISVPDEVKDICSLEKVFILHYWIKLNGKPFKHGQVFKDKNDVLAFCERNNITIEELKKVWKN